MFDELPRLCRENLEHKHVYSKCRSDQLTMWNRPSMTSWDDSDAETRLFYIDMFQFCCNQANCCAIKLSPQSFVLSAPFLLVIVFIMALLSIKVLQRATRRLSIDNSHVLHWPFVTDLTLTIVCILITAFDFLSKNIQITPILIYMSSYVRHKLTFTLALYNQRIPL